MLECLGDEAKLEDARPTYDRRLFAAREKHECEKSRGRGDLSVMLRQKDGLESKIKQNLERLGVKDMDVWLSTRDGSATDKAWGT